VSFRSATRRAPVSSKLMPGPELVASFQEPGGEEEPGRDREVVAQKKKRGRNNRRPGKRKPPGIELAERQTEGERAEAAVPQVPDAGTDDVMPEAPVQIPQETRLQAELEDVQRLSAAGSLEDSGQRTAGPVADVGTAAAAAMAVHDVRSWDVEQVRAFLQ
jgi:hypothetical protein